MTLDHEDVQPSVESATDKVHRMVRAAISVSPFGGAGVELFNSLVTPPLEARRIKWMHDVTDSLNTLEQFSDPKKMATLFAREEFLSILIEASRVAVGSHEQEKLEYLRNSVVATAISESLEYTQRSIFIRFVSEMSAAHIRVLDVTARCEWALGRDDFPERWLPELKGMKQWFDLIWRDLINRGLLDEEYYNQFSNRTGMLFGGDNCMSLLGYEFLEFVGFDYASERIADRKLSDDA